MTGKTLKELNVKPGDVVEWISQPDFGHMTVIGAKNFETRGVRAVLSKHGAGIFIDELFRIISRAPDTPKLWRDMTPEEKGALLLAHHEGKDLQYWQRGSGGWARGLVTTKFYENEAYRIRPEPKVESVTIRWQPSGATVYSGGDGYTHIITFNLIDGKPDCDSVKMEEL